MIFSYKCQYGFYFTNWLNYIHIIRKSTGEIIIRVKEFKSNVCEELFDKITKTMEEIWLSSKLKFKEYYNKQENLITDTMSIFVSKIFLGMSMRTIGCSILIIVNSFSWHFLQVLT